MLARKGHPLAGAKSMRELLDADWLTTSITDKAETEFGAILTAPSIALVYRAAAPPTPATEYFCDMIRRAAVPMMKLYPQEP